MNGRSGDPYPLDLGRSWTYQSISDNGGILTPGKDQEFIVASASADTAIIRRFYGDWEAPPTLARKVAGRVVLSRYVSAGPPATDSITILHLPVTPGESWAGRQLVGASEWISVAGQERVVVPRGNYDAWHVVHDLSYQTGGSDRLDYWYAPGTGMVRAVERATVLVGGKAEHCQVTASLK